MDYNKIKNDGYEGTVDINLEISLFEYGLIHKINEDGTYTFIYGTESDGCVYNKFDMITVNPDDIINDWEDNLDQVAKCCGLIIEQWEDQEPEQKIFDLVCSYGYINIFGEGFNQSMDNTPPQYIE